MKKILSLLLLITLGLFLSAHAYTLSDRDEALVEKALNIIDGRIQDKGESYKDDLLDILKNFKAKASRNTRKYEIIDRLIDGIDDIEVISEENEDTQSDIIQNNELNDFNVNLSEMRSYWLGLYNDYRDNEGLDAYTYDSRLESTGQEWTNLAVERGYISHERTVGDGFYNYPIIEQWFQDRGVSCAVSGRSTSVENTGYGSYSCSNNGDCTQKAKTALDGVFEYYLSEESYSGAHYRTLVSPYLQYMGLGISFADQGNGRTRIYTTAHFCTEFK